MTTDQELRRLIRSEKSRDLTIEEFTGKRLTPQTFFDEWRKTHTGVRYYDSILHYEIVEFSRAYANEWLKLLVTKYYPLTKYCYLRMKVLERDRSRWKKKYHELLNASLSEISGEKE